MNNFQGMTRRTSLALLASVGTAVGCGGGSSADTATPAFDPMLAHVQITDGDKQVATVGQPLERALAVRLVNAAGQTLPAQTVSFVVTGGSGSVFVGTVQADASGIARERWTLGPSAGTQRVEVRTVSAAGQPTVWVVFEATARPAAPASMAVLSAPATGTQLQPLSERTEVRVLDRFGNPCPGVEVTFTSPQGGSANPPSTTTDNQGIARTLWTLALPLGDQFLDATVGAVPAGRAVARAVAAPPGPPAQVLKMQGDGLTGNQHTAVAPPLVVRVVDALGNGVPAVAVRFASGTTGFFVEPRTLTTNTRGEATLEAAVLFLHTAGTVFVEVTSGAAQPAMFRFDVLPAGQPWDGLWDFQIPPGLSVLDSFTLPVADGIANAMLLGGTLRTLGTIDRSTGVVTLDQRRSSMTSRNYSGQAVLNSTGQAVASGTWFDYPRGVVGPTGPTGTWTAVRR